MPCFASVQTSADAEPPGIAQRDDESDRTTHDVSHAERLHHCFFPVNVPEAAPPMSIVPFIVEALSTVAV